MFGSTDRTSWLFTLVNNQNKPARLNPASGSVAGSSLLLTFCIGLGCTRSVLMMDGMGWNGMYRTSMSYNAAGYGPTWGGGHDLHVSDSMKSANNYCNPNVYQTLAPVTP